MLRRTPPPAPAPDGPASSEVSSDDAELPQCKIRRNYSCSKCAFYTQNPRAFLTHARDVHFEKFKIYDCPNCVYASRHHQKLVRHERMVHGPAAARAPDLSDTEDLLEEVEDVPEPPSAAATGPVDRKSKFFSCEKCNYVTHLKSRFTKHVKYHSMPMIKCTLCDFRTPYKWNLDRHNKNHGGGGAFCCSVCNFTADIKQSLTVHEMNHHTPPAGAGHSAAARRRSRPPAPTAARLTSLASLAPDEGSGDSLSLSEVGSHLSEMSEMYNNDSNDMIVEVANKDELSQDQVQNFNHIEDTKQANRKKARPIPQLIPLNTSTPTQGKTSCEPPAKRFKEGALSESEHRQKFNELPADISVVPVNTTSSSKGDCIPKKKNESFFDKLKQRLLNESGKEGSLTCKNCGFESKCLSEHSVHEKTCSSTTSRVVSNTTVSSTGSTRCQNCRHRCKSSADLYLHMQTCNVNNKMDSEKNVDPKSQKDATINTTKKEIEGEPHPMENVVFVWNNINRESNKFETPLDININEETFTRGDRHYDPNNVDALHDNEGMSLSPTQAVGKRVYKCPHCPFWASTASRFHVHIVGHLNKKPFECSLCQYKSNWRWDITKHIKLKSARDPEHNEAKVLMTDETGRRNYSKYQKFLAMLTLNDNGENIFQYIDENTTTTEISIEVDDSFNDNRVPNESSMSPNIQPLNLQTSQQKESDTNSDDTKKPRKTLWKCKKCNYRDPSKEALLEHIREHYKTFDDSHDDSKQTKKSELSKDPGDVAYRCGHCNQLSNWKHVIQRHCRLKHDGVVKVIATEKPKPDQENIGNSITMSDLNNDLCTKCPFRSNDKKVLMAHVQQHTPSPLSIFKCYFCNFFVKTEIELMQHLVIHGIRDPEEYVAKAMGNKDPIPDPVVTAKRHKCTECPYETNSKSQYMYHEQFHRLPADTPYKCQECNYSVSKRHLLHQHMKVHGIIIQKRDTDEFENPTLNSSSTETTPEKILDEIPYVWVSAKNEFHKMHKCRYCSYVNSQKCKIPIHEKVHYVETLAATYYKCLECKFTCSSASRLSDHSKWHSEIYGRIYFAVEKDVPDEEQIVKLRELIDEERKMLSTHGNDDMTRNCNEEEKILFFCQKCPTRYFSENELKIHLSFHENSLPNKCQKCEFSVSKESQLVNHVYVHTDEYQSKTKMLKLMHETHPEYKEPVLELQHFSETMDRTWIVSDNQNCDNKINHDIVHHKSMPKQYLCKLCPAQFPKNSALTYHMGLHGGKGEHRCKTCNYTVKNSGNLAKHEALHDGNNVNTNCDYESGEDVDYKNIPLSGTDLFQRKTEAQKRVLTDKDKLVKPNDHFPPVLQADPQFGYLMHGNPEFVYPTYLKNGRQKEKRYKCHKCPSAFEKREQYRIHLSLHGSKQRYKCEVCDYSVKYYANYVQHMRKHQMNDEAQAERKKGIDIAESENQGNSQDSTDNIKLAIKTMPRGIPKSDFQQFSVSDQQTLRLLQRRRSINSTNETIIADTPPTKDRKQHSCILCPYMNQRLDALMNHHRRHDPNDNINKLGNYHKCWTCDLVVVQSHFLRDHLRTHFTYHKSYQPQCFAANKDSMFTITKLDEDNSSTEVIFSEEKAETFETNEDRVFVNETGEVVVIAKNA